MFFISVAFMTTVLLHFNFTNAQVNPSDILKESDKFRGDGVNSMSWDVEIQTTEDEDVFTRTYNVKSKNVDAFIETLSPAKNKGEIYVFNDNNMWYFKPSLKKPVSIPARQKLSGQTSNGDITSTKYSKDYNATLEKIEKDKYYILLLVSKNKNTTYDKIRYWVNIKSKLAEKAEFLGLDGQAFKKAEMKYENSYLYRGQKLPFISTLVIGDVSHPSNTSTLIYKNVKNENFPDSIFNVNNISR